MKEVKYRTSAVGVFLWFFLFFSLNEGKQTPYKESVASALRVYTNFDNHLPDIYN
jgi:hypothetical protein